MTLHVAPALPPSPQAVTGTSRRPRGWGRRLSARRVGKLIRIDQCWLDRADVVWRVCQVHRADHQCQLVKVADGRERQRVGFAALGAHFRVLSEGWSR